MTPDKPVRDYWITWAATLLFFGAFYSLLVPLPRYLTSLGLPDWQLGVILGAFGVAALLGRPLAGVAADRWGRQPLMLCGGLLLVVGALGTPLTTSGALLFLLRLLQAAGYVAFTTAGTALAVALTPPAQRGRRLAIFGLAANVAMTTVPAAVDAALPRLGLAGAFALAAGLAVVAGGLAWAVSYRMEPARERLEWRTLWSFPRQLWLPMAATFLFGVGFAAFFQFAPLLAERRGVAPGLLYAVYGGAIIATRLITGRWLDIAGIGRVLGGAAALMVGGLLLAAWATTVVPLILAAALIAAGGGIFHPTLIAHHALMLPGEAGRSAAAFYVGMDLGIGLGTWLLGFALELAGLGGLYGTAALLVLAVTALLPALGRQRAAAALLERR